MPREVTTHLIPELPDVAELRVFAGEGDQHGVPHFYGLRDPQTGEVLIGLYFQSGDPRVKWNGGTTLAYLACIRDFLEACQASKFACGENADAISCLVLAMASLQLRIERRIREQTMHTHQTGAGEQPTFIGVDMAAPEGDRTVITERKPKGQIAYEGYFAKCGGKSLVSNAPLPTFGAQKPEIQEAWEAAAAAVVAAL